MDAARIRVPWAPQVTRILRWKVLDNVEVAHVWVHWCHPSLEWGPRGQEGIPTGLGQNHRIRQCSSSAVHQFHCLQARRLLSFILGTKLSLGTVCFEMVLRFFFFCINCHKLFMFSLIFYSVYVLDLWGPNYNIMMIWCFVWKFCCFLLLWLIWASSLIISSILNVTQCPFSFQISLMIVSWEIVYIATFGTPLFSKP